MNAPISVLLVEDHALLRLGIRASLSTDQELSVVGEADNGESIISEPPVLDTAEHPSDLCNIINRCLKKDPSDRFANAGEIHRALLVLSGEDF